MQKRHIVVEGGIRYCEGCTGWGVKNTRPVVVLLKRQSTPRKIDTFMRCYQRLQRCPNIEPALVNVSCSSGMVMLLWSTIRPKVKYFYKCPRRYYLIANIEQLHYLKFEKNDVLI